MLFSKRTEAKDFAERNDANIRASIKIPHRIDLAGGFFDQKKINSVTPGSAVMVIWKLWTYCQDPEWQVVHVESCKNCLA